MRLFALALLSGLLALPAAAQELKVVASIRPVHALVAAVMGKAPQLIVGDVASPHHFNMRPSHAAMLQDAGLVFWIGPQMESFLQGPLATLAGKAKLVALIDDPAVRTLPWRQDAEATHEEAGHEAHEDNEDDDHGHGGPDGHIWLDPANAAAMAGRIARELAAADPAGAGRYEENAAALVERLNVLDRELEEMLRGAGGMPYIVFHDAYQYFERRYGLAPAGVIALNPESAPGAERIRSLRARIAGAGIGCIFAEPQFDARMVAVIAEGMPVRTAVLDPLGSGLQEGPELYFDLMRKMAASFRDCLAPIR